MHTDARRYSIRYTYAHVSMYKTNKNHKKEKLQDNLQNLMVIIYIYKEISPKSLSIIN